jgi:hypothetical protein
MASYGAEHPDLPIFGPVTISVNPPWQELSIRLFPVYDP